VSKDPTDTSRRPTGSGNPKKRENAAGPSICRTKSFGPFFSFRGPPYRFIHVQPLSLYSWRVRLEFSKFWKKLIRLAGVDGFMRILALGFAMLFLGFSLNVAATATEPLFFAEGWTLFSVPLNGPTLSRGINGYNNCHYSPVWHWTGTQYVMAGNSDAPMALEAGKAYWIRVTNSASNPLERPCGGNGITFSGTSSFTEFNEYALHAGWNMVGGLNRDVALSDVKAGCQVTSGPWAYNTISKQYEKSLTLQPYNGFWIKVSEACALHSGPTIYNG